MIPARIGWIAVAYAALGLILWLDAIVGGVHMGALAVVPLLLIGFYGSRWLAATTAVCSALVFAALDHDAIRPIVLAPWPIPIDAAFLAITFIAILFAAERLRSSQLAAGSDSLTSLPNRRVILQKIQLALARAKAAQTQVALVFVDLDNFKSVNDRYGHAVGDSILRYAAERLAHTIRDEDVVGRVGGDEFVVLLERITNREQAQRVATDIETALSAPFRDGVAVDPIGATTGIALFPLDAQDSEALLLAADRHMYERKAAKREKTA